MYTDSIVNFGEEFWNSLTKEQQLECFCAMSRRIYRGELEDQGTFRHVLYEVFGFGPDAYVVAQLSGYLSIHNAIFDGMQNPSFEMLIKNNTDTSRSPVLNDNGTLAEYVLKVNGHSFSCHCGCNVFHKPYKNNPNIFKCNACDVEYMSTN